MILANYFSAWVGLLLLGIIMIPIGTSVDLHNVQIVSWVLIACAYIITLLLEFPFVAFCFWKADHWFKNAAKANFLIQSASYLLLIGWYALAVDCSMIRDLQLVDKSQLQLPEQSALYYIAEDESIRYLPLSGETSMKIGQIQVPSDLPYVTGLMLSRCERHPDLCSVKWGTPAHALTVVEDTCKRSLTNVGQDDFNEFPSIYGRALRLGTATESPWSFVCYPEGLLCTNEQTGARENFGLALPPIEWYVHNLNHLPGDLVVFQLGWDQICLMDLPTRHITLLARGRSPVVVLDGTPPPAPAAGADLPVISWKESAPQ